LSQTIKSTSIIYLPNLKISPEIFPQMWKWNFGTDIIKLNTLLQDDVVKFYGDLPRELRDLALKKRHES